MDWNMPLDCFGSLRLFWEFTALVRAGIGLACSSALLLFREQFLGIGLYQ